MVRGLWRAFCGNLSTLIIGVKNLFVRGGLGYASLALVDSTGLKIN